MRPHTITWQTSSNQERKPHKGRISSISAGISEAINLPWAKPFLRFQHVAQSGEEDGEAEWRRKRGGASFWKALNAGVKSNTWLGIEGSDEVMTYCNSKHTRPHEEREAAFSPSHFSPFGCLLHSQQSNAMTWHESWSDFQSQSDG